MKKQLIKVLANTLIDKDRQILADRRSHAMAINEWRKKLRESDQNNVELNTSIRRMESEIRRLKGLPDMEAPLLTGRENA